MVQLQLFHPPLLCLVRERIKGAQMKCSRAGARLKDFREKTVLPLRQQKCYKATLGSSKRDHLCDAEQSEKGKSFVYIKNCKWEVATEKVLYKLCTWTERSLFSVLQLQTLIKVMGILQPQQLLQSSTGRGAPVHTYTPWLQSPNNKKTSIIPKWWNTKCFLMYRHALLLALLLWIETF